MPAAIRRVQGDLDRPDTLAPALTGIDTVYLICAAGQVADFLAAARDAGVGYVVRQSTLEAGAEPPHGPGTWHRDAEGPSRAAAWRGRTCARA